MTRAPNPLPYLLTLDTYIPGKRGDGLSPVIKLSSNENPRGASPLAIEAYMKAAPYIHRYPEDGALKLREAIGALHGFAPDKLICGAGSDDVIRMLCHTYAGVGDEVIYSAHGFAMYHIYARQHGASAIAAPEQHFTTDCEAILACVTDKTRLVFIANPNNPTGSYLPKEALHQLRSRLREDIILVLDGAYSEYMVAQDYTDGRELCEVSNTVIMRTFSKAYGLSSLRIGWGYGAKEIIDMLYKTRSPFNMSQPAIDAAIAALRDQEYIAAHVRESNSERARLEETCSAMGITVHPSYANFILLQFQSQKGKSAADVNMYLRDNGLIVREIGNYGMPDFLRISIGTPEENNALLSALAECCA